jgi:hypothetical protein
MNFIDFIQQSSEENRSPLFVLYIYLCTIISEFILFCTPNPTFAIFFGIEKMNIHCILAPGYKD